MRVLHDNWNDAILFDELETNIIEQEHDYLKVGKKYSWANDSVQRVQVAKDKKTEEGRRQVLEESFNLYTSPRV
jgi:hypothetical protein